MSDRKDSRPVNKDHVHAELMAQYAEDVKTHSEPWKLWLSKTGESLWWRCMTTPLWDPSSEYRREPKNTVIYERYGANKHESNS